MDADVDVYINDFNLRNLGFVLETPEGWRSGFTVPDRRTGLPGRVGTVRLAREDETQPRRLILVGHQLADDLTQLNSRLNELKGRLYEGDLEIRMGDALDWVFIGRTDSFEPTPIPPALMQAAHRLRISILCSDPLIYARYPTVVSFGGAAAECPLATGVSVPRIRIGTAPGGALTNPTITYRDHRGVAVTTMTLTATLGASQWLEIDNDLSKITDQAGANRISALTGGDFIALDPHHAAGEAGPYPTLEVSVATGAVDFATAEYRKTRS
jgi:hypothetical protein